ncbi:MAG: carboxymuconolactone decarboxylase family protein [Pseudonocardia sp.]|nr:carboxymuconolactone decarboxylase family protein [Pseudonocardia sp.]
MRTSGLLPWPTPEELNPEQREFYDTVVTSPRAVARPTPLTDEDGRLYGPFNAMLTNPVLGDAMQAIGIALRFSGKLPRAVFEALVLMVAVERHASYEWYAHAPIAQRRGVTEAQLAAIREHRWDQTDGLLSPAVVQLARDTLAHVQPSERVVRAVEKEFGAAGVTEVVVTVTNYDAIAALMRTWDAQLPEDVADPLA